MNFQEGVYKIKGGRILRGNVKISGAKNSAMKAVIASLLFSKPVVLKNIPEIRDIREVYHIVESLGGKVKVEEDKVFIDPIGINKNKVDLLHGAKVRVSFMFLAPLLKRFGECYIPNPGGCRIGARPIDRIIEGVKALGGEADYDSNTGYYYLQLKKPPKGIYRFNKPSHTGTETLVMLGSFTDSEVIIENSALEPEVDELIQFLNQAGANIKRKGGDILIQKGEGDFEFKGEFSVGGDRNEAVTFAVLGLVLGDPIEVEGVEVEKYEYFLRKVEEVGGRFEIKGKDRAIFYKTKDISPSSIETSPHPGFMTDWQPLWAVLMTQANGNSFITERVFENRFAYVEELKKLGAKMEFLKTKVENPEEYFYFNAEPGKAYYQTIKIKGKTKLHEGVLKIADLRAGATLAIASLIASGESIIEGVNILDRGYEKFEEKIRSLGGLIERL